MLTNDLQKGLDAVEDALRAVIDSDIATLTNASNHIIDSGGKRIRPQVVLLSYIAAGGTNVEEVATMGAAVELVHTASLVHDDINDHSDTRRGQVAVHSHWGRTFALLTGDYMFAKVYEMMARYGTPCNKVMSTACVTLVEGETLQAAAAKAGKMDRETYKQVIERKTASLFRAGAEMGGIYAGADENTVEALRDYGHYLGVTFQIVDDILDLVGDPEAMGKPVGLDVAQNRGVMVANNGNGTHVAQKLDPIAKMKQDLREAGAADIARLEAQRTAHKAYDALDRLPESEARERLRELVDLTLSRDS